VHGVVPQVLHMHCMYMAWYLHVVLQVLHVVHAHPVEVHQVVVPPYGGME